jgi:hypothetical protein
VIKYGWREVRIRSISKWFHLPLLVGVPLGTQMGVNAELCKLFYDPQVISLTSHLSFLAFAGVSLYGSVTTHCYVLYPPFANGFGAISVFLIGLISLVIWGATINMLIVYCQVRRVDSVGNNWRMFSSVHSSSATKKKWRRRYFGKASSILEHFTYLGQFCLSRIFRPCTKGRCTFRTPTRLLRRF